MSDFLTTSHKAIQRLHQFAWIEAITLTKIDKQAAIALLSLILQLLLVSLRFLLLSIRLYLFNLWSLRIISQELTELQ